MAIRHCNNCNTIKDIEDLMIILMFYYCNDCIGNKNELTVKTQNIFKIHNEIQKEM